MKPKFQAVLEMCIENGLKRGYARAFKHTDNPSEETIYNKQFDCIMEELYEWFEFGENNADE